MPINICEHKKESTTNKYTYLTSFFTLSCFFFISAFGGRGFETEDEDISLGIFIHVCGSKGSKASGQLHVLWGPANTL